MQRHGCGAELARWSRRPGARGRSGRPGPLVHHDGGVDAEADPVRARYLALVDALVGVDGVTPPPGGSGFGRGSLKYQGKIFAMLVRGELVVRLPEVRVAELITAGEGAAFDANKGTPMREWLSVDPRSRLNWLSLATEALEFAHSAAPKRGSR